MTTDTSDFDAGLIFEQDPIQIIDALLPLYLNATLLRALQACSWLARTRHSSSYEYQTCVHMRVQKGNRNKQRGMFIVTVSQGS